MPRDSNDIWKHDGPDTGLIQLVTQPWGYYTGRLVSHDPNWVVIVAENGLKQEIQTSKVKGVMDLKVVVDTTNTTRLRVRNVDGVWSRPHLLAYFVPTILAGVTEPTASGGSGFFGLLFAMMGFRIPHVLYNYMGEFFGVSYESRSFRTTPTSLEDDYWNVRYVALTPGLSYRGLVSIGVTIGVPVTASLTTFDSGKSFGEGQALRSSMFNPLIEPRIILAWPLLRGPSDGGLLLLAEAGYPLGTAFNGLPPVSIGSSITRPNLANSVRLPEISLGLSYVLSLHYQPDHVQME